jgi:toxin secretion/phage lysis holin
MNGIKISITAILGFIASILGVLYVPVLLMVACNVIDYITGLMAVGSRDEKLSSYKGIRGITKKVCMWLLVVVGAIVDGLLKHACTVAGIDIHLDFLVACVVCIWIICNELLSILENISDIGVPLPPFLMPIIEMIKKQTEEKASVYERQNETTSETAKETE